MSPLEAELEEVRSQLDGYEELKERERRLTAAIAVLRGETAPSPAGGTRPRGRPRGGGGASAIDREAIVAALRQNNDMPASYISDQLELGVRGISGGVLSRVLKEMVEDGTLTKTGERRATRYSLANP
jgi:hypothetical protein